MIKDYNKALPGLEKEIISKIHAFERRRLLIRQSTYGAVSLASLVGIVSSGLYVSGLLSTSGVYSYISLLFSDINALSYWKELAFSIVESLPFLGVALVLGTFSLFLWSILKTVRIQASKNVLALA